MTKVLLEQINRKKSIGVGAQSTLGGRHFFPKIYAWKWPNFTWYLPEKTYKMPDFYIIFDRKIFFRILGGKCLPTPSPVSYAYEDEPSYMAFSIVIGIRPQTYSDQWRNDGVATASIVTEGPTDGGRQREKMPEGAPTWESNGEPRMVALRHWQRCCVKYMININFNHEVTWRDLHKRNTTCLLTGTKMQLSWRVAATTASYIGEDDEVELRRLNQSPTAVRHSLLTDIDVA